MIDILEVVQRIRETLSQKNRYFTLWIIMVVYPNITSNLHESCHDLYIIVCPTKLMITTTTTVTILSR